MDLASIGAAYEGLKYAKNTIRTLSSLKIETETIEKINEAVKKVDPLLAAITSSTEPRSITVRHGFVPAGANESDGQLPAPLQVSGNGAMASSLPSHCAERVTWSASNGPQRVRSNRTARAGNVFMRCCMPLLVGWCASPDCI